MAYFNEADRARIARAVAAAQGRTRGDIVSVIAREADDYIFISLLWAAGFALVLPLPLLMLELPLAPLQLYEIQIAAFLALALAFRWRPIKLRLVPRAIKRSRANHLARAQFLDQGLHLAEERCSVMIFVSVAERYVEIVADQGIAERVHPATWQGIVQVFVGKARDGHMAEAFEAAIERCGQQLAEHFPRSGKKDEAAVHHLVEL